MVFVLCSFEIAYGTEWKEHALTETFNGPVKAVSVDMDNDGDYDVLALSFTDQSIVWFENENGRGQYSNRKLLAVSEQGFYDVIHLDVDDDGLRDILYTNTIGDIRARRNTGNGTFGAQYDVYLSVWSPLLISFADDAA
eukprot:g3980.t1